jgi:hypothetical protein
MASIKWITGAVALGAAMLISLFTPSAQAGYIVTLTQQGSNVVATGSGAIDLTGLSFLDSGASNAGNIEPGFGQILTGPLGTIEEFVGFKGPTSFGSGGFLFASSGTGDLVGISGGAHSLVVPLGYVSDSALSDTSTWVNATFASLGVTPGTYEWIWGTGANQNFTLVVVQPIFAGTPGKTNCHGQSVSALARQFGGLNNAAAALGYSSVSALQEAIMAFCEE